MEKMEKENSGKSELHGETAQQPVELSLPKLCGCVEWQCSGLIDQKEVRTEQQNETLVKSMCSSSSPMVLTLSVFTETEIHFIKVINHRKTEFKKSEMKLI